MVPSAVLTGAPKRGASWKPLAAASVVTFSSIVFVLSTRHGIGILPDSVAYMQIGGADHFAPLYTWLLHGIRVLGIDVAPAAKYLGLLLIVLNTLLVWELLWTATRSLPYTALGTALIVISPVFLHMHTVAMTEPLLLAGFFSALLFFAAGVHGGRSAQFALAGATIGLTMLARFAAAPILVAVCLCRLLDPKTPIRRRLADCLLMSGASAAVFGTWLVASELTAGQSTGRALAFHGQPDAALWWSGLQSASTALLPAPVPSPVRMLFLAIVMLGAIWTALIYARAKPGRAVNGIDRGYSVVPVACGLFVVCYAAFLIFSVFIQATLPLNGRMLLPLYVAAVVMLVVMAAYLGRLGRMPRILSLALLGSVAVILLAHGARSAAATASAFANGIGYAERAWASSPILRFVEQLPSDTPIYSNAPDLIAFRLRRDANYLPRFVNHLTLKENPRRPYQAEMDAMRDALDRSNGHVVFVDRVDWRFYLASEQELVAKLNLTRVHAAADGRAYRRESSQ